jgi:hypothetical protein
MTFDRLDGVSGATWFFLSPYSVERTSSMQNTITFERANPLQGMATLARSIALPHEYAPARYPSFPALERTAVMSFNSNASYSTIVGDSMGLLCRQASFPLWLDQDFTNQAISFAWDLDSSSGGASDQLVGYSTLGPVRTWRLGNVTATGGAVGVTGSSAPTLPYPVMGVDNGAATGGREFVYVPAGWNIAVVIANNNAVLLGATTVVEVGIERWVSPGEVNPINRVTITPVATNRSAGAVTTLSTNTNLWIRVSNITLGAAASGYEISSVQLVLSPGIITYTPAVANWGTASVAANPSRSLYPFFYPLEFANSTLPWYSTRTTATALLMTNVTQVLNKSGSITAGRVPPQVLSPWEVTKTYVSSLHPAEKALLGLEAGFYTYVPPSTDMSEFWDYTCPSVGVPGSLTPACPVYRLDNTSLVNAFFLTAPVAETFAINLDFHIEFRTVSTLWQLGMSTLTLESFHQAQIELMSHGFFYNNEDHKKLKSLVGKAKKAAGVFGPMVKPLLPAQARMAYDFARSAQKLMSSKPGKTPQPTSAAGSGMVKKPAKQKGGGKTKGQASKHKKK